MEIFSYTILNIMVFLSSLISCRFLINFSSSQNKVKYYIIYIAINFILSHFFLNLEFYIPEIISDIISIVVTLIFCQFILNLKFHTALLTALLKEAIWGIYNIVDFTFSGILLKETDIAEPIILVLCSLLILILSTATFEIFIKRYGKYGKWSGSYSILYICPLSFIYLVCGTIISVAYNPVTIHDNRLQYSTTTMQDLEIFFITFISLASIFVILYFYEKVMTQIKAQNQMSILQAYTDMQKQYIDEIQQKYKSTKIFRHDINNHMITLAGLVKNNESEKATEYLNKLEHQVADLSFEVFSGNAVIDVVLKEKLSFAKEQGIKIICDVQIPKYLVVDDFDLSVIFFNALDNAIKACAYADDKFIDIVAKKNNNFFIVDIMNSFNPVKYQKGLGIGLETIKFIAEKYGGYLEIDTDKEIFRVSIIFNLK